MRLTDTITTEAIAFIARHKASFASAVYAMANPSVRPSVTLHSFVSKQGNAEGCGLHHRVAQCLYFSDAKSG